MKNRSYVFPRGIKRSDQYIRSAVSNISSSYQSISSCVERIESAKSKLMSLNGKYVDGTKKEKLYVAVDYSLGELLNNIKNSDIEDGVNGLNSKLFDMDKVVNQLELCIDQIEKNLV